MYAYGLIGNCQASALIKTNGSVEWFCLPRPDSPPVFGAILDKDGGDFSIHPPQDASNFRSHQYYLDNTNILVTILEWRSMHGHLEKIEITDFFPRFEQYGRIYRPIAMYRRVRALEGSPMVRVHVKPVMGWTKEPAARLRGNSHFRFRVNGGDLRFYTNVPLTEIESDRLHLLGSSPSYFAITWGLPLEDDLRDTYEQFFDKTSKYWRTWVKHCNVPTHFQKETIRSALALKLHVYEETGAILAALTTSLPETEGDVRNWDYRFCWLRDAFYTLSAFRHLGHFEEIEGFLSYLLSLVKENENDLKGLRPVYTLARELPLPEIESAGWEGWAGSRPVRSGNQAAEHVQNDVYGEMILAICPLYLDERFLEYRTPNVDRIFEYLGRLCERSINQPDAGLWELRGENQIHTFTNLICWTALKSLEMLRSHGLLDRVREKEWKKGAERAEAAIRAAVHDGVLRNGPRDHSLDASLLQMALFGFPDKELVHKTVDAIRKDLSFDGLFLYRYRRDDDFGTPESSFVICSFWLIQALSAIGKKADAFELMSHVMACGNHLMLFAEHYDPQLKKQLGNFPQAYSHVGLINAAFAVSPTWHEFLSGEEKK